MVHSSLERSTIGAFALTGKVALIAGLTNVGTPSESDS